MRKSLKCPCCGGMVESSSYGLYCKNKCGLYLGRALGTPLSADDVEKLLNGDEIIIQVQNKSTGKYFHLAIKWDCTYDAVGSAKYLHYATRYPYDDEVSAFKAAQSAVSAIPPTPQKEITNVPYSYRFVDALVEVTDDYQIIGGIFDGLTVVAAIAYCRQLDNICFSQSIENHIRCVIYQAINKAYDKLGEPTIRDKVLALLDVFEDALIDFISEVVKASEAKSLDGTSEQAWSFVEHEMVFYLKNSCYRSGIEQQDKLEVLSMKIIEFIEQINRKNEVLP